MSDIIINDLPGLLSSKLGTKKIKDTKLSNLISKGENFGSEMIKLDVTTVDENGKEETLHGVAKTLPKHEMMRQAFKVQVTYTNEMAFYDLIIPTLQDFQRELGVKKVIDWFPECYATRKNLNTSDIIDDNAVIVLENLIIAGFQNIDRYIGFDLETAKLVLRDLASFHAVPLALRLKKPEVFEKVIKPHCVPFEPMDVDDYLLVLQGIIEENKEIAHLASKITGWKKTVLPVSDLFGTITHTDMWTNNTMQKFENGRAVNNKLVDFQVYSYGSPATDVFFFLWSSVPQEVLEKNLDLLLNYYYEQFVNVLKEHKVDVSPYTYEKFLQEIDKVGPSEFQHAFVFHNFIIHGKKNAEMEQPPPKIVVSDILKTIPVKAKEKSYYMTQECTKRGWLK
ncbi:uncharacterized protein [Diabrotica undecimpunctata]|uniref:uncharacterized protein n=1 Tax=Diabrotica undecimpunctata TaxID=50387 RepID=UPI003B640B29